MAAYAHREAEEARLRQEQLRQHFESELKQQQLQLKMSRRGRGRRGGSSTRAAAAAATAHLLNGNLPTTSAREQLLRAVEASQSENRAAGTPSGEGDLKVKGSNMESSDSGSDLDSSLDDSDGDTESSSDGEDSQSQDSENNSGHGSKRSGDDNDDTPHKKRRRVILDLTEIRIPLEHGWRRETKIRAVGQRGLMGEVVYFAPCGKKLRTYPEVERYLGRNSITDLMRENFTFSTKVNVGDFFEIPTGGSENDAVMLSEADVMEKFMAIEARKQKLIERKLRAEKRRERKMHAEMLAQRLAETKMQRKQEQQELARKVAELKMKKKMEKEQQQEALRRAKQLRVMELKKMRERQRVAKQQDKMRRQQQFQMEREMRTQQIIEEREMKKQQHVIMKEQDRERKRQHLLLVKALEARKKQEDRERMKEEKKNEKKQARERKMEQRRFDLEMAREMKKPIEDMCLRNMEPLPALKRIPGVRLPGSALADCIMILEFLQNFWRALDFDEDCVPTLEVLQGGILNEEPHCDALMILLSHLLRFAIDDPGPPNPKEAVTKTGQKITDIAVNDHNISEVFRIFILCRNGKEDEMTEWLKYNSFQALNSTQKGSLFAFLCNELLCSKVLSAEIEGNIDTINNLRRDKWIVEGKLRKMRMVHARKARKMAKHNESEEAKETCEKETMTQNAATNTDSKKGSDDEDEHEHEGESGNESDITNATGNVSEGEEEEGMSLEEMEKKMEKLNKQHNQYRDKVFNASHKLRAMSLGQDRFRRWYWLLPQCGGIFVEGLESAEPEYFDELLATEAAKPEEGKTKEENKMGKDAIEGSEADATKCSDEAEKSNNACSPAEKKSGEVATPVVVNGDVKLEGKQSVAVETVPMETEAQPETKSEASERKMNGTQTDTPLNTDLKLETAPCSQTKEEKPVVNGTLGVDLTNSDLLTPKEEVKPGQPEPDSNLFLQTPDRNKILELFQNKDIKTESEGESPQIDGLVHKSLSGTIFNNTLNHVKPPLSPNRSAFRSIDSILSPDSKANNANVFGKQFVSTSLLLSSTPLSTSNSCPSLNSQTSLSTKTMTTSWFSVLPKAPCDEKTVAFPSNMQNRSNMADKSYCNSPFMPHNQSYSSFSLCNTPNSSRDLTLGDLTRSSTPQFNKTSTPCGSMMGDNMLPYCEFDNPLEMVQTKEAAPIPADKQRGWWCITSMDDLEALLRCLHQRGIRERVLQKSLLKYKTTSVQGFKKANKPLMKLEATDESRRIAKSSLGAPDPDQRNEFNWAMVHEVEMSALEEVETLEDRVYHASLQVKMLEQGWKLPQRVSEEEDIKLVSHEHVDLQPSEQYILEVARQKLLSLETNIERRYLKPPFAKSIHITLSNISSPSKEGSSTSGNHASDHEDSDHEDHHQPREDAQHPPEEGQEPKGKAATKDLVLWRQAVKSATSAAQLMVCLIKLNKCIAWEKSVMRVICQICAKDNNEAELLLCDSCDKGYHTYCFKPKMDTIPDGDWYCYECIAKVRATGDICCIKCGKRGVKLMKCDHCTRAMHIDCMEPPLTRLPKKWSCPNCIITQSKGKSKKRKSKGKDNKDSNGDRSENENSNGESSATEKPSKSSKEKSKDKEKEKHDKEKEHQEKKVHEDIRADILCREMYPCKAVLTEMEKHEDGWPFLVPVNIKQFPSYKKFIKQPMDFSTIRNKLRDTQYKEREEFAADARLVFNNCETFNEDDSAVGQAGHAMRKFFEARWPQLCEDYS